MRCYADERGVCREGCGKRHPLVVDHGVKATAGRTSSSRTPPMGFPRCWNAFEGRGTRGRSGWPSRVSWASGQALSGVGRWGMVILSVVGMLLLAAEPAEALTKAYSYRDDVAVIANNVSVFASM